MSAQRYLISLFYAIRQNWLLTPHFAYIVTSPPKKNVKTNHLGINPLNGHGVSPIQ